MMIIIIIKNKNNKISVSWFNHIKGLQINFRYCKCANVDIYSYIATSLLILLTPGVMYIYIDSKSWFTSFVIGWEWSMLLHFHYRK